jgi:hypothetical protein
MPATLARGLSERIKRGAPDASLDRIDIPKVTAVCSVGVTGRPSAGVPPGPPLPGGGGVADDPAAQAVASNKDGTVSVLIRSMMNPSPGLTSASATMREYHR